MNSNKKVRVQVGDILVFLIDVPNEDEFAQWLYATVGQKYALKVHYRGGMVEE